MADESEASKHRRSIPPKLRSGALALASVVLIAFAACGILIALRRLPRLSEWEGPLGITIAAIFAFAILWKVPQWQVGKVSGLEPKERFDRVNEARKTLAQIIGGTAVLAGFYSTVQNLKVAQKSLAVTQENQILAQKSFVLAQEGQITDRFSRAIEQLGAVDSKGKKNLDVRLGGIYALQRIADESAEDHWPIMEVLTAYIRDNAPIKKQRQPKRSPRAELPSDVKPATDIQATLTVLGTRNVKFEHEDQILNLHATDVRRGYLHKANLMRADLSEAHLTNANLSEANLSGTRLLRAHLNAVALSRAILSGADLSEAHLNGADLSGADFSGANLNHADLNRADLKEAVLSGAFLSGADLSGTRLLRAHLIHADLNGVVLSRALLSSADLSEANLNHADLNRADFSGAHLNNAYLYGADLSKAYLGEADLSGANLSGANLIRANLSGTDLSGANLTTAKYVEQQQIDSARGDNTTKLPSNLHMPEGWR